MGKRKSRGFGKVQVEKTHRSNSPEDRPSTEIVRDEIGLIPTCPFLEPSTSPTFCRTKYLFKLMSTPIHQLDRNRTKIYTWEYVHKLFITDEQMKERISDFDNVCIWC